MRDWEPMTTHEDWETPEGGANEPMARKLADLGPLMHDIAEAVSEPPDPVAIKRIRDALLREHRPILEDNAPKQGQ